jgi:hypothetical protein
MLQFPALMRQWPSPPLIPASTLLPVPATTHEDELLLAVAESDHEDKVPSASRAHSSSPRSPLHSSHPRRVKGLTDAFLHADQLNEIRKTNRNMVIIGKPAGDVKEEDYAEAEDDEADNVEDSDDFDQETG